MSHRYLEWIAQRAMEEDIRATLFWLAGALVLTYAIVNLWPLAVRTFGKAFIITFAGVAYVGMFAFSLWTLGRAMGLGW